MTTGKAPGWDANIISTIAKEAFDCFENMFRVDGGPEGGEQTKREVQSRVAETCGSVAAFSEIFKSVSGQDQP